MRYCFWSLHAFRLSWPRVSGVLSCRVCKRDGKGAVDWVICADDANIAGVGGLGGVQVGYGCLQSHTIASVDPMVVHINLHQGFYWLVM